MIRDFSVTPKAKNNNAKLLMCLFFVISLISLVVALFIDRYKGVVGMVTLASLTTAILVYTKYVAVVFHYDVRAEGEEEPLFIVRQTVGNRNVTLCRVALAGIVSVVKETKAERRAHKSTSGVVRYYYMPTIAAPESYRISVSSRYEKAEINVEISDEFAQMLTSRAKEAKEMRAEADEDED